MNSEQELKVKRQLATGRFEMLLQGFCCILPRACRGLQYWLNLKNHAATV